MPWGKIPQWQNPVYVGSQSRGGLVVEDTSLISETITNSAESTQSLVESAQHVDTVTNSATSTQTVVTADVEELTNSATSTQTVVEVIGIAETIDHSATSTQTVDSADAENVDNKGPPSPENVPTISEFESTPLSNSGTALLSLDEGAILVEDPLTNSATSTQTIADADAESVSSSATSSQSMDEDIVQSITEETVTSSATSSQSLSEADAETINGPGPQIPAYDYFSRTVGSGTNWGTSDKGGSWSRYSGSSINYSVDGSKGIQDLTVPAQGGQILAGQSIKDVDIVGLYSWDEAPAGDNLFPAGFVARYIDTNNFYSTQLRLEPAAPGTLKVDLRKHVGGSSTGLGTVTVTTGYVLGTPYWVRFQIVGTTLRVKVWKDGDSEPVAWTNEVTGQTDHTGPGAIGTRYSAGGSSTNAPTITLDNFLVIENPDQYGAVSSQSVVESIVFEEALTSSGTGSQSLAESEAEPSDSIGTGSQSLSSADADSGSTSGTGSQTTGEAEASSETSTGTSTQFVEETVVIPEPDMTSVATSSQSIDESIIVDATYEDIDNVGTSTQTCAESEHESVSNFGTAVHAIDEDEVSLNIYETFTNSATSDQTISETVDTAPLTNEGLNVPQADEAESEAIVNSAESSQTLDEQAATADTLETSAESTQSIAEAIVVEEEPHATNIGTAVHTIAEEFAIAPETVDHVATAIHAIDEFIEGEVLPPVTPGGGDAVTTYSGGPLVGIGPTGIEEVEEVTSISINEQDILEEIERTIVVTESVEPVTNTVIQTSEPEIRYVDREVIREVVLNHHDGEKEVIEVHPSDDLQEVIRKAVLSERAKYESELLAIFIDSKIGRD